MQISFNLVWVMLVLMPLRLLEAVEATAAGAETRVVHLGHQASCMPPAGEKIVNRGVDLLKGHFFSDYSTQTRRKNATFTFLPFSFFSQKYSFSFTCVHLWHVV